MLAELFALALFRTFSNIDSTRIRNLKVPKHDTLQRMVEFDWTCSNLLVDLVLHAKIFKDDLEVIRDFDGDLYI